MKTYNTELERAKLRSAIEYAFLGAYHRDSQPNHFRLVTGLGAAVWDFGELNADAVLGSFSEGHRLAELAGEFGDELGRVYTDLRFRRDLVEFLATDAETHSEIGQIGDNARVAELSREIQSAYESGKDPKELAKMAVARGIKPEIVLGAVERNLRSTLEELGGLTGVGNLLSDGRIYEVNPDGERESFTPPEFDLVLYARLPGARAEEDSQIAYHRRSTGIPAPREPDIEVLLFTNGSEPTGW